MQHPAAFSFENGRPDGTIVSIGCRRTDRDVRSTVGDIMRRLAASIGIICWTLSAAVAAKATFTSTWKAPDAGNVAFAGKKVVGMIVSNDMSLRISSEEALARELTSKGVQGLAAYKVIPREEIRDKDTVKAWFERTGAAGVVVLRLVDLSKETSPSVVAWQSMPYYGSFGAYYPYAWGATIDLTPASARTDVTFVVETLIFDVGGDKLLWAGTSESTNPKGAQALIKDIVDAAVERMTKDGLIRRR